MKTGKKVDPGRIFYIFGVLASLVLPIFLSVGMGRLVYGPKIKFKKVELEMSEMVLIINNDNDSFPVKFINGIWRNFDDSEFRPVPNMSLTQR